MTTTSRSSGSKRVLRTKRVLKQDGHCRSRGRRHERAWTISIRELLALFREKEIPHLVVFNKADLDAIAPRGRPVRQQRRPARAFETLKNRLGALAPKEDGRKLLADLVCRGRAGRTGHAD